MYQILYPESKSKGELTYRVAHLLANLGWVDIDLCCSTLCLVLLGLIGNWQKLLSRWARGWSTPNQSQPNAVSQRKGPPGINTRQRIFRIHLYFCNRKWLRPFGRKLCGYDSPVVTARVYPCLAWVMLSPHAEGFAQKVSALRPNYRVTYHFRLILITLCLRILWHNSKSLCW